MKIILYFYLLFLLLNNCSSSKTIPHIQPQDKGILNKALPIDSLHYIIVQVVDLDENYYNNPESPTVNSPDSTDHNYFQYSTPFWFNSSPAIAFNLSRADTVSFYLKIDSLAWEGSLFELYLEKGDYHLWLNKSTVPSGIYEIEKNIGSSSKKMEIKF